MRTSSFVVFATLLAGCASFHHRASLNAEQAKTVALRLANDKAFTLYHCQPFHDGEPAHFVAGQWVWTETCGYGRGDVQATIALAADGLTNSVDVELLDSRAILP